MGNKIVRIRGGGRERKIFKASGLGGEGEVCNDTQLYTQI